MSLDLNQLRAFFAVAQTLSYTEASRRLYLTQPAVSHAVAKLERGLGAELFCKAGKKLALTDAGRTLYEACEKVFYELETAEERIAGGGGESGTIRLGATVEFGTTLLVKYLKGFILRHPGIHVDFQFRHELLRPLLDDEADMIVDCRDHKGEGLERTPLFREDYVVIASPDYIRKTAVREPGDLAGCNVLSLDKAAAWWGNFLHSLPAAQRPELRKITAMNHIRAIINAAMESLGVGFVPRYCVLKELKAGALVNVFPKLKLLEDNFYIYQKKKRAGLLRHRLLAAYLKNIKATQLEKA